MGEPVSGEVGFYDAVGQWRKSPSQAQPSPHQHTPVRTSTHGYRERSAGHHSPGRTSTPGYREHLSRSPGLRDQWAAAPLYGAELYAGVSDWTVAETLEWFRKSFPFAPLYEENFQKLGIDATTMGILTERDLKEELLVTSSIHRRAIMAALCRLKGGAAGYDPADAAAASQRPASPSSHSTIEQAESVLLAATEAVASNAREEVASAVKSAATKAMDDAEKIADERVRAARTEAEAQVRIARQETVAAVQSLADAEATLKSSIVEAERSAKEEIERTSMHLLEQADTVAKGFSQKVQEIARREYESFVAHAKVGKLGMHSGDRIEAPVAESNQLCPSQRSFTSALSLHGDFERFNAQPLAERVEFEDAFRSLMAKHLSTTAAALSLEQIKIVGYRGGSIVVEFSVTTGAHSLAELNTAVEAIEHVVQSSVGLKIAGFAVVKDSIGVFAQLKTAEDGLRERVAELEAEAQSLQADMSTLRDEKTKAVAAEEARVRAELEPQLLGLRKEVSDAKDAAAALANEDRPAIKDTVQIDGLQRDLAEKTKQAEAMTKEAEAMQADFDSKLEELESQVKSQANAGKTDSAAADAAAAEQAEQAAAQIASLTSTVEDLQKQTDRAEGSTDDQVPMPHFA